MLMIQLVKRVGGILAHALCCYNIYQVMGYTLSTEYGMSEFKYISTVEETLQGSGQGGPQSPIMCTCSIDVIMEDMEDKG